MKEYVLTSLLDDEVNLGCFIDKHPEIKCNHIRLDYWYSYSR